MSTAYVWLPLCLLYLVLSGNFEARNVVAGLLIAWGITALARPRPVAVRLRRLPGALWALAQYVLLLIYELVTSGLQVARIVFSRQMPIAPGIVAIPTSSRSELAQALNAHAISVAPGELVIEIDEAGVMYTHCLDASRKSAYIYEAQRTRDALLNKIFGLWQEGE